MNLVESIVEISKTQAVVIDGKTIPLKAFAGLGNALPVIYAHVLAGHDAETIIKAVAPDILAVIEAVANAAFPGVGNGIKLLVMLLGMAQPMTREEEELWFRRVQGSYDS